MTWYGFLLPSSVSNRLTPLIIKKVARRLDVPVRFDPATDGGFIVRKATVDEAVKGDKTGARLGEANKKEKK